MTTKQVLGEKLPFLHVSGTPYEMGKQRGEMVADMVASRVRKVLDTYAKTMDPAVVTANARRFEVVLDRDLPEALEELRGVSDGSGVDWTDLRNAVMGAGGGAGVGVKLDCSVMGVTGPATTDGATYVAKNGDLYPPSMTDDDVVVMHVKPEHGYSYLEMGILAEGVRRPDGINEMGLALVGCGQGPKDGVAAYQQGLPVGVPVYDRYCDIYARCATVEEALAVLRETPRGYTGRTMILADAYGAMAKVEISYGKMSVQYPEHQRTFPTNFVTAGVSGTWSSEDMWQQVTNIHERPPAYVRYDRYMNLLHSQAGSFDLERVKAVLGDHDPEPGANSICKHDDGPTLECFIFEPKSRRAWAALGNPCTAEFHMLDCLTEGSTCTAFAEAA